jgi:glycosidase
MTDRTGFPISKAARERYGAVEEPGTEHGHLAVRDRTGVRRLTQRMNDGREPGAPPAHAGEMVALGLLHEIMHLVVERYEAEARPDALAEAAATVEGRVAAGHRVFEAFADSFPDGSEDAGGGRRDELVEELLLNRVANENDAAAPLRELFDDRPVAEASPYERAIGTIDETLARGPAFGPDGETLDALLRAPARASPTSLAGQLRYVRDRWRSLLGDALDRLMGELDLALGVLEEEERAMHLRFGGGGAGGGFGGRVDVPSFVGAEAEVERFSADSEWMPRLVLIAKSTYVWLDQLSRTYGRDIRTLDAIPDEELDRLARSGITGLWLIGLWERSRASERIKRMRGNPDAVASAYSLDDYRIAADLGGEDAYANLRDRAWARGVRLASDMVPNHMGIDSSWVIEHPDWFLALPEPPYPSYTFGGPDLSDDGRAGVVLEDHYWDDSDAAVVFKRFDRGSGDVRYIYHGNDGTSFPWNDTAQLDFLKAEVREAVIQTILAVARRFPIIRFDAAMVLARRHIRRLWWPEPGTGGGIPSRAEWGSMPQERFDALMPTEFWRDVVDRVAAEVPDTLLLAEAFWMLEGYFVRTLGMHRVYNSAFMHMLRDENDAGYRTLIKETLEFDPAILGRYVNFMNNPDEKTAVEQFGKGDKYIGVATLMATLPGLPMIGHGQIEGFGEKYGMEFRRATLDERPDPWLVERHEREIFPLLHRRAWFANADRFLLYDFETGGGVDEHVYAYSNGSGPTRSLVVYHNRFASTAGHIRESAAYAVKEPDGSKRLVRRSLADGLGIPGDDGVFVAFRDARTGLEYLRSGRALREHGLFVALDAYQGHVFWEFRELHDGVAGQWARLAAMLDGRGVLSLEDSLRELQLEPVHEPVRALLRDGLGARVLDGTATTDDLAALEERHERFLGAIADATGVDGSSEDIAAAARDRVERVFVTGPTGSLPEDAGERAALLAWLLLAPSGGLAPGADPAATSRAWFDELRIAPVLAAGLREAGLDEGAAWAAADRARILLDLPRPSRLGSPAKTLDARLLEAWLARDDVRAAMGVNTWEGTEWLDRDRFSALLEWAARLEVLDAAETRSPARRSAAKPDAFVARLAAAAEAAGYRLDRLRASLRASAPPTSDRKPSPRHRRRGTKSSPSD